MRRGGALGAGVVVNLKGRNSKRPTANAVGREGSELMVESTCAHHRGNRLHHGIRFHHGSYFHR